jgi:hypothetical protein
MRAEEFAKNVISLDNSIRFAGVIERSGHVYVGLRRDDDGGQEYLHGRNTEISLTQSAYIVDLRRMFEDELGRLESVIYVYGKVRLFSIPVRDHVLAFSTDIDQSSDMNLVLAKVSEYVKSVESSLSLYPPSNIVNEQKKQTARNLHQSGMSEEVIAEQLDLDTSIVQKLLVEEAN